MSGQSSDLILQQARPLSEIFSQSPNEKLRNVMRTISNTTRSEASEAFLATQCNYNPSRDEIIDYLNNYPNGFCLFNLQITSKNNDFNLDLGSRYINRLFTGMKDENPSYAYINGTTLVTCEHFNNHYYGTIILGGGEEANIRTTFLPLLTEIINPYERYNTNDTMFFVDVKTFQEIIKQRITCIALLTNYVRELTLKHFRRYINIFNKYPYSIQLLDLYLCINGYILGLAIPRKLEISTLIQVGRDMSPIKFKQLNDEYNHYIKDSKNERDLLINQIEQRILVGI